MTEVLRAADRALYEAKDSGRNRCVVAPQPSEDQVGEPADLTPGG